MSGNIYAGNIYALNNSGTVPEIFNTDQGCQFTSAEWIDRLKGLGIKISMDGKGRWMDNIFIERLWRSVKYEHIYLFEHPTIIELCAGLEVWFERYNHWRPHESHSGRPPATAYAPGEPRRIIIEPNKPSVEKSA